mmetsp:Transcript_19619/g.41250  ORF Transcript_19619/g.41250 Transcript_19619/m.41250 type:complete len:669 (-) Transcript_19619:218-2224(-)
MSSNTDNARSFLWEADADVEPGARLRNTQRSTGFSTRDFVVDQSVNLNYRSEASPSGSTAGGENNTGGTHNSSSNSIISGLFRANTDGPGNRGSFDEYGDASALVDSEEYIDGDMRRRSWLKWGHCRQGLCSKFTLTLAVSLVASVLVVKTLASTIALNREYNINGAERPNGNGNSNSNSKQQNHQRYDNIRSRIVKAGLTSQEIFEGKSSPQKVALNWLAVEDSANIGHDDPALLDRYGLAVLYYSSTNALKTSLAGGWTNSDNWMTEKGICSWHGVECLPREQESTAENDFTPFTKTYDANNRVTGIRLQENNMEGQIPDELSAFEELLVLDVRDNKWSHKLPASLGKLSKLRDLLVKGNDIVGTLPVEYSGLTELHILNLAHNQFQGPIPDGWLTQLTKLRYFSVSRNTYLTGTFPNLSRMTHLTGLFLEGNKFEGNLPEWLGSLTSLMDLRVGKNKLGGSITILASLKKLETLYIDNNLFTGSIPNMFDRLYRLVEIQMQDNAFEGSIPLTLTHLQTLRNLNLASNQLNGVIPPGLGLLTDVMTISLANNRFEGSIPTLLGRLDDITDLTLSNNTFSGKIPTELGGCFRLKGLQLQKNTLTGDIPPQLGMLKGLTNLRLESNQLADTGMPPEVCNLRENEELTVLSADERVQCECCTALSDSTF